MEFVEPPAGRNMRTLHGRRVRVGDLLDAGLLSDGDHLSMTVGGKTVEAEVIAAGRLRLNAGQEFQTPSRAASSALGGGSFDGWIYWRTADGRTLDSLRQELLDQVAASSETSPATHLPGELTVAGSSWLKEVRERAVSGRATTVPLRTVLSYWGLERRDSVAVDHVVDALAERRLQATPSVLAAALDDAVVLSMLPEPSHTEDAVKEPEAEGQLPGVGLALGTLMNPDRPLVSVQPQHTISRARSLMRLNGYSQLPILGGRTLKGAVTWESIAQALGSGATGDSAVTSAHVHASGYAADRHLLEVIDEISASGFVVVIGPTGPAGLVTYADVADAFVKMATPFALIGDLDRRLRAVLNEAVDWEFLSSVLAGRDFRSPADIDQLSFSHYVTAFASTGVWEQLGWWIDQSSFIGRLDELRVIRNKVTHFNPDPPTADDIGKLRLFNTLLVELTNG